MQKIVYLLFFSLLFPLSSFAVNSGNCTFAGNYGVEYRCYSQQTNPIFYSFSGSMNTEYYSPHRMIPNTGSGGYYISIQPASNVGTFTVYWTNALAATGATGQQGNTGATGQQGNTGATGSIVIDGTVGSINLSTNISYSGIVIQGYFDNYKESFDMPSWNLVLHLNALTTVQDVMDIVLSGTGLKVFSATPIDDVSDPRVIFNLRRITEGDILSCGWYGIDVPSSWLQGKYGSLPNAYNLGTAFELVGCPGYKTQALQTIIFSGANQSYSEFETGSKLPIVYYDGQGNYFVSEWSALRLFLYLFLGFLAVISLIFVAKKGFNHGRGNLGK